MTEQADPFLLTPWFSERPWGRKDLRPWYPCSDLKTPVGEAWLTGPQCVVETGNMAGRRLSEIALENSAALLGNSRGTEFPLLVKLLFPSDKLSVQVHPDDIQAQAMGRPRGKTECWYVLEAQPDSTIMLGLKAGVTKDAVRAAIAEGTLEDLMTTLPVVQGEMVFVDAGTVHAIGPGVVLLETQETCDITFRMFDYGRPRELHVEEALDVMKLETKAGKVTARPCGAFTRLIEQAYFVVDRYDLAAKSEVEIAGGVPGCLIGLSGSAAVKCGSGLRLNLSSGRAVVVPAQCASVSLESDQGCTFVRCFEPAH